MSHVAHQQVSSVEVELLKKYWIFTSRMKCIRTNLRKGIAPRRKMDSFFENPKSEPGNNATPVSFKILLHNSVDVENFLLINSGNK